jgi:hypothetical protein
MMLPPFRCRRQNAAFLLTGLSPQHGLSERSPDERSDIRVFASAEAPACRFTHAGYLLASSHRRHSGMRRKAQTRNPRRHNITWRNGFPHVQLHIKARSPGANLMLHQFCRRARAPDDERCSNCSALDTILGAAPDLPVVPICRSPARLPPTPETLHVRSHPVPTRGAYRDRHGRWARDAMDAFGDALTNGADADGEVVWA